MSNQILSHVIKNESDFKLEEAIEHGKKTTGLEFLGLNQMVEGGLYSPSRPVAMYVSPGGKPDDVASLQMIVVTPNNALMFTKKHTDDPKEVLLEFLGESKIYLMKEKAAFEEMEPLYFVVSQEKELDSEFSLFDTYGVDVVASTLKEKYDGKNYPDSKVAKDLVCQTISGILNPLIDRGFLMEYKVIDESEKILVLQVKSTPKGTYCRLEIGL